MSEQESDGVALVSAIHPGAEDLDPATIEDIEIEIPDPRTPGLAEAMEWGSQNTHHPHIRVLWEELVRLGAWEPK